jgi:hypothetical protein
MVKNEMLANEMLEGGKDDPAVCCCFALEISSKSSSQEIDIVDNN